MIYRRPQDFDTAKRFLLALRSAEVQGAQSKLRDAVVELEKMQWFDRALRPLYGANAVVKLVTNSLVPTIQELVLERQVLDDAIETASRKPGSHEKHVREYTTLRQELEQACASAKGRPVTDEFAVMRDAMHAYATHAKVQATLSDIYCALPSARLALRLMTQRIGESLKNDSEIRTSDDIPLEAFKLSA